MPRAVALHTYSAPNSANDARLKKIPLAANGQGEVMLRRYRL